MTEAKREIVKVQRPLMPPDGDFLIYAKGHDRVEQSRPSPALLAKMGDKLKGFFYAEWRDGRRPRDAGAWIVGDPAPDQNW